MLMHFEFRSLMKMTEDEIITARNGSEIDKSALRIHGKIIQEK